MRNGGDIVLGAVAKMELGVERFCVGCKRKEACPNDKDACVSQHLFVWAVGWADDPTVIERIEGRLMRPGIVDCNGGG